MCQEQCKNQRIKGLEADAKVREAKFTEIFDHREVVIDENEKLQAQVDMLEAELAMMRKSAGKVADKGIRLMAENGDLQAQVKELQEDCRKLADAVVQADGILCNDLHSTKVKNAHDIMEAVDDVARNRMTEP